jgi:acetyl-CoA acetyltransferase
MSAMAGRQVAVAGIGYSGVFRGAHPTSEQLTLDATRSAIADAGLLASEVDGIFEYQYAGDAPVTSWVQRTLGTSDLAAYGDIGGTGASGMAAVIYAIAAVASGACEVALAYRTILQAAGSNGRFGTNDSAPPGGSMFHDEFLAPYGAFNIIPTIGMRMQRRKELLGGREEDYGHIALNARKWAALNDRAIARQPLSMDDYLGSRFIAEPLRLLDCDYPISGSCAVVITTAARARTLARPLVIVDSHATATGDGDWIFGDRFMNGGSERCAERLWSNASIGPDEIDLLGIYDGFTYQVLSWIEALGFCREGEAGDWLEGGRTINPGGSMPLNTAGGQLAEGRLHGIALLAEAVHQLRGNAGKRQVQGAQAALVTNSFGPAVAGLIVRRD